MEPQFRFHLQLRACLRGQARTLLVSSYEVRVKGKGKGGDSTGRKRKRDWVELFLTYQENEGLTDMLRILPVFPSWTLFPYGSRGNIRVSGTGKRPVGVGKGQYEPLQMLKSPVLFRQHHTAQGVNGCGSQAPE